MTQLTGMLLNTLETAFNRLLEYDPETRSALAELSGRCIAVEVVSLDFTIYLLPTDDGLRLSGVEPAVVDVTVSGRPGALLGLMTGRGGNGTGQVELRGDIHLAQALQNNLRQMEIDWEEFMARYLGDTAARKIRRFGNDFRNYLDTSVLSLGVSVSEYLRYERRWLPVREEVDAFVQDVDRMRDDVERLQQRLIQLELQQEQSS